MLVIRLKENVGAPDRILPLVIHGITTAGLSFLGESMPYISPHTSYMPHTPARTTQEPLAKSSPSTQGITGTLSMGRRGSPVNSLLSLQAKSHFHTPSPQGRLYLVDHRPQ